MRANEDPVGGPPDVHFDHVRPSLNSGTDGGEEFSCSRGIPAMSDHQRHAPLTHHCHPRKDGPTGLGRQILKRFGPGKAVAVRIETGGPNGDRGLTGYDGKNPTADTALSRQPHPVGEISRGIVMTARHHDRVDLPRALLPHHAPSRGRIDPAVREKETGPGEIHTAHGKSALPEVEAKDGIHIAFQIAECGHEMSEARVPMPRCRLRSRHFLVDRDPIVAGKALIKSKSSAATTSVGR